MTKNEIETARRNARDDAAKFALLLLLALEAGSSSSLGMVLFDRSRGMFFVDGKAISDVSVRKFLDRIEDRYTKDIVRLTTQLHSGTITLSEWKRSFDRIITTSHVLKAAFILGGIGAAVKSVAVVNRIDEQLAFADNFAEEIRKRQAGPFGKIRARAKSYLASPHLLYSDLQLDMAKTSKEFTEVLNVLRPAEHCIRTKPIEPLPICTELTKLGWMDIAEMPPIGTRKCRRWCRCYLKFR